MSHKADTERRWRKKVIVVIRYELHKPHSWMASLMLAVLVVAVALFGGVASAKGQVTAPQEGTAADSGGKGAVTAQARNFSKYTWAYQSGWSGYIGREGAPITEPGDPFRFRRTSSISSIDRIIISMTMYDGDTGYGEFDKGELILALDGIKTGIELNDFNDGRYNFNGVSGVPNNARAIKEALKKDGKLRATIVDKSPNDNYVQIPDWEYTDLEIRGKMR